MEFDTNNGTASFDTTANASSTSFSSPTPQMQSLSQEEQNDVNKIKVEIADDKSPLVILFGPKSCGKTMTLVRLTRYLKSQGYSVSPVTSFRPMHDQNYSAMCDNFDAMINSEDAANSTNLINFMLVKVSRNGRTFCQILEGPGEHYFDSTNMSADFPKYINAIIDGNNRKVWSIMLEPDNTNQVMDMESRRNYVSKIEKLRQKIDSKDRVIFVFNKVDKTEFIVRPGVIRYPQLREYAQQIYPGIFRLFMNENPITKLWKPYNCGFVAQQTGSYNKALDGTYSFTQGNDCYPRKFWKQLLKEING